MATNRFFALVSLSLALTLLVRVNGKVNNKASYLDGVDAAEKKLIELLTNRDNFIDKLIKPSLATNYDNSCYDRVRLPDHVKPRHYNLVMQPDLAEFTFQGAISIDLDIDMSRLGDLNKGNEGRNGVRRYRQIRDDEIILHTNGLKLTKVWYVNGKNKEIKVKVVCVSEKHQVAVIRLQSNLISGNGKIYMAFNGTIRDDMRGFYRTQYKAANGELRYHGVTNFEPTDARSAFPCFDEPAMKATFDVTMIAPKDGVALANTRVIAESILDNKRRIIKYARTPVMSTYLVAFVVGEFDYIEAKSKGRPIRVYTSLGDGHLGQFALDTAKRSLEFLEEYFKLEFPLSKIDLVAVPDFEMGAMENWGLILFREQELLIDDENSSVWRRRVVAKTVTHEMSHQWFGNLVTMSWWDDLWLNEGFAEYMKYLIVDHLYPHFDIWKNFIAEPLISALEYDARHGSHAIQATVNDPSEIGALFDDISYYKGCAVVRLLHDYLTGEVFRAGVHHYLTKFAYNNTKTINLWDSFEYVSGKPVGAIMNTWTNQPGYPCLDVSVRSQQGDIATLDIEQYRFFSHGSRSRWTDDNFSEWTIPLAIVAGNQPEKLAQQSLMAGKSSLVQVNNAGAWIKLNAAFSGFYCVNYSKQMRESLNVAIKSNQLSDLDKMNLLHDSSILTKADKMGADELLTMLTYFVDEKSGDVWHLIDSIYVSMGTFIKDPAYKEKYKKFGMMLYSKIYESYGFDKRPDEPPSNTVIRDKIIYICIVNEYKPAIEESLRRFDRQVSGGQPVDPSIRYSIYSSVGLYGSDQQYEKLYAMYQMTNLREEKLALSAAISTVQQPSRIYRAAKWVMSDEVRTMDKLQCLLNLVANKGGAAIMLEIVDKSFEKFLAKLGEQKLSNLLQTIGVKLEGLSEDVIISQLDRIFHRHNFGGARESVLMMLRYNSKQDRHYSRSIAKFLDHYLQL